MNTVGLRELVRRRFIHRPWGYILDCARPDGSAVIPTPEECERGIPNVLGWGTANENGAFFTGLYLYALCRKYDLSPDEELKGEILGFCDSLFRLCDVCKNDGCIARGVAEDGHSHYPFSSEDQAGPFILGLWRLSVSKAADDALRAEIDRRLKRTLSGIRKAGWRIPTEWDGVTRGVYCNEDWRGSTKLLFCAKLGERLGLLEGAEFEALRNERPNGNPYTRYEIVSHGFGPDMVRENGLIQFWIDVCANLCAYELISLDADFADYYRRGNESNGYITALFMDDYKKYDTSVDYNYDWRVINECAKEWSAPDEAVSAAGSMLGVYARNNPRHRIEHGIVGRMLFGAWIAAASPDAATRELTAKKLEAAAEFIDFNTFCMSYAFAAVGTRYMLDANMPSNK